MAEDHIGLSCDYYSKGQCLHPPAPVGSCSVEKRESGVCSKRKQPDTIGKILWNVLGNIIHFIGISIMVIGGAVVIGAAFGAFMGAMKFVRVLIGG